MANFKNKSNLRLSPSKQNIHSLYNAYDDINKHRNACLDSLLNYGLVLDIVILDGKFRNTPMLGRTPKKKSGWYVGQEITISNNQTIILATYGDFREGVNHTFNSYSKHTGLTKYDKEKYQQALTANQKLVDAEKAKMHANAAIAAKDEFNKLSNTGNSDYLVNKQVEGIGVKYGRRFIAVPIHGIDNDLRGIQKIFNDGSKRFTTGAKIKGGFHLLGKINPDGAIHFAEGYSTAATAHQAINQATVVCFNAGNLSPVIAEFRKKYPDNKFVICADNDQFGEVNTGLVKATEAAAKHTCSIALPVFKDLSSKPTDFNDLQLLGGDVAGQLNIAKPQEPWVFNDKLTLIQNIDRIPLPAPDNAINSIMARSVLEHPKNPYNFTIDTLERRVGKLSKSNSNWLNTLLKRKDEDTRKFHTIVDYNLPEFDINQPNAAEILSTSKSIYIDSRSMGSGKTLFTAELLKYLKTHNKTFGYTAHRRSIITATAERLEIEHYNDISPYALIQDLAACINSALQRKHLLNFFRQCECIVLDEFKQIIEHITLGTFDNRSAGFDLLMDIIKNIPVVYVADADMNDRTMDILNSLNRPMFHIKGDERKPTTKIEHTTRKIAKSEFLNHVKKGDRGIFQCDGVATAKTAFKDANSLAPEGYKTLLIHQENQHNKEQSAYLKSPNVFGKKYDLIILTPIVSSGFSIELDYDFHIGIFSGVLSPTEIIQTLGRSRKSKSIILGFDAKRKQTPLSASEQLAGITAAEGRLKLSGGVLVHEPNAFDLVAVAAIEEREKSCQQFAHTTLLILMQKGYPVEAFTEPDKITEIKGTAKLVKMEHTLNVINSDDISDVEYIKLQHANKVLESEYFSIEKHECKSQLALDNEPLEEDVLFWDGGRIKPALERFEIVTAQTDDISMLDEYESETMTAAKDKSYATSQKIIFSSVMNLLQDKKQQKTNPLEPQTDKLSITKETLHLSVISDNTKPSLKRYNSERITAAIDYLIANYAEASAAGLGNFKSLNRKYDARTLGYFLKRFGLKHSAVGDNKDRKYQITEESVLMMKGITNRRQIKQISVFKQANEFNFKSVTNEVST